MQYPVACIMLFTAIATQLQGMGGFIQWGLQSGVVRNCESKSIPINHKPPRSGMHP